jgi:hypothetical protein
MLIDKYKNMFLRNPGKPTKIKEMTYLTASTLLGIFLSFIAHAFIEMAYMRNILDQGKLVKFYGGCALPPSLQISLFVVGVLGGFFLGRFWWRKVYIERVWVCKKK